MRYSGTLNAYARRELIIECIACKEDRREKRRATRYELLHEAYRRQVVDYGTLWTGEQTARLMQDVLEALIQEHGDLLDDPPAMVLHPNCHGVSAADVEYAEKQRAPYQYLGGWGKHGDGWGERGDYSWKPGRVRRLVSKGRRHRGESDMDPDELRLAISSLFEGFSGG